MLITVDDLATISGPVAPAVPQPESLPAIIDRARNRLAEARTSAEILDARAAAMAAAHYAKFFYFGHRADAFRAAFADVGFILFPPSRGRTRVAPDTTPRTVGPVHG